MFEGNCNFTAPELYLNRRAVTTADFFSLSVSLCLLATKQFPFGGLQRATPPLRRIENGQITRKVLSLIRSLDFLHFLKATMRYCEKERLTVLAMLDHPFLTQLTGFEGVELFIEMVDSE